MARRCPCTHHTVWTLPPQTTTYLVFERYERDQQYDNGEAVQEPVCRWLQGAGMDFYYGGIFNLI